MVVTHYYVKIKMFDKHKKVPVIQSVYITNLNCYISLPNGIIIALAHCPMLTNYTNNISHKCLSHKMHSLYPYMFTKKHSMVIKQGTFNYAKQIDLHSQ